MTATEPRQLREYQTEAVNAVINEWGNDRRATAVVLPTGSGKSTVIAAVAATSARMGLRVVMMAHRAELLTQMAEAVAAVDPELDPVGIVRATEDESDAQIVAASLQTLTNSARHAALGERQVILWDEVHHGGAESWVRVLENFGTSEVHSRPFFCGFTATLRREDGKALRRIIDTVAYERNLRWAIDEGYLVRPDGLTVRLPNLDLDKVRTRAGDFAGNDLAEVMEAETEEIVKAIARHAADRRAIIFAASVQSAYDIADGLQGSGIPVDVITGSMSYLQRQPTYAAFRDGATQMLVTVQVLTEGADFPMCDCVVIARPTQSQNLYSQMVGRALRLYTAPDGTEKTDALVLDLVGSSRVLKLVTLSNLDAGTKSRTVDEHGAEIETEDDEVVYLEADVASILRNRRLGPIETIGIDLLDADHTSILWLATRKGVPFVQSGERMVFLWEVGYDEHGPLYKVGDMSTKGAKDGGWLDDRPWPLEVAKELAEDQLYEWGVEPPRHAARWRMRGDGPSDAQIRYAANLRIEGADTMTKGRLSDEITIALASARLDGSR